MMTIAWYNAAAIFIGVLFIIAFFNIARNDVGDGALEKSSKEICILILIVSIMVFYAIWGGIFWW